MLHCWHYSCLFISQAELKIESKMQTFLNNSLRTAFFQNITTALIAPQVAWRDCLLTFNDLGATNIHLFDVSFGKTMNICQLQC